MIRKFAAALVCLGLIIAIPGSQFYAAWAQHEVDVGHLPAEAIGRPYNVAAIKPNQLFPVLEDLGPHLGVHQDLFDRILEIATVADAGADKINAAHGALEILTGPEENSKAILGHLLKHLASTSNEGLGAPASAISDPSERFKLLAAWEGAAKNYHDPLNSGALGDLQRLQAVTSVLTGITPTGDPKETKAILDETFTGAETANPAHPIDVTSGALPEPRVDEHEDFSIARLREKNRVLTDRPWLAQVFEATGKKPDSYKSSLSIEQVELRFQLLREDHNTLIGLLDGPSQLLMEEEYFRGLAAIAWLAVLREYPIDIVNMGTLLNHEKIQKETIKLFCELYGLPPDLFSKAFQLLAKVPNSHQNNPLAWMMEQEPETIQELQQAMVATIHVPAGLHMNGGIEERDPKAVYLQASWHAGISHALTSALTAREERILRLRSGWLVGGRDHTLKAIGILLNINREWVRQIEAKAIRKLKRPSIQLPFREASEGRIRAIRPPSMVSQMTRAPLFRSRVQSAHVTKFQSPLDALGDQPETIPDLKKSAKIQVIPRSDLEEFDNKYHDWLVMANVSKDDNFQGMRSAFLLASDAESDYPPIVEGTIERIAGTRFVIILDDGSELRVPFSIIRDWRAESRDYYERHYQDWILVKRPSDNASEGLSVISDEWLGMVGGAFLVRVRPDDPKSPIRMIEGVLENNLREYVVEMRIDPSNKAIMAYFEKEFDYYFRRVDNPAGLHPELLGKGAAFLVTSDDGALRIVYGVVAKRVDGPDPSYSVQVLLRQSRKAIPVYLRHIVQIRRPI